MTCWIHDFRSIWEARLPVITCPKISRPKIWKLDKMINMILPHYDLSFILWNLLEEKFSKNANMTYLIQDFRSIEEAQSTGPDDQMDFLLSYHLNIVTQDIKVGQAR